MPTALSTQSAQQLLARVAVGGHLLVALERGDELVAVREQGHHHQQEQEQGDRAEDPGEHGRDDDRHRPAAPDRKGQRSRRRGPWVAARGPVRPRPGGRTRRRALPRGLVRRWPVRRWPVRQVAGPQGVAGPQVAGPQVARTPGARASENPPAAARGRAVRRTRPGPRDPTGGRPRWPPPPAAARRRRCRSGAAARRRRSGRSWLHGAGTGRSRRARPQLHRGPPVTRTSTRSRPEDRLHRQTEPTAGRRREHVDHAGPGLDRPHVRHRVEHADREEDTAHHGHQRPQRDLAWTRRCLWSVGFGHARIIHARIPP